MGPSTLPDGTLLIGTYQITGLLGSGGFANTYSAVDLSLSREVAIKEFFPVDLAVRDTSQAVAVRNAGVRTNFEWARERFVREARALAKFRHPNIVRVFNVFDANNTSYMVLELVHGMDMGTWIRRREVRASQQDLDQLIEPLLDALEVVHRTGMLHRDIKPENIYIRAENVEPVLLDFGAAKFDANERRARTTAAIVSSGYSPNEAYTTDKSLQGPWTDIYSLAATIYHAVTGKPPPEAVQRIMTDAYVPLAQSAPLRRVYRSTFLSAIDAALSVRPKSRPQTVDQWRRMLNATVPAGDAATAERMTRIAPSLARTRVVDRSSRVPSPGNSASPAIGTVVAGGMLLALLAGIGMFATGWPFEMSDTADQTVEESVRRPSQDKPVREPVSEKKHSDSDAGSSDTRDHEAPAAPSPVDEPAVVERAASEAGQPDSTSNNEQQAQGRDETNKGSTEAAVPSPGLVAQLGLRLNAEPAATVVSGGGRLVSAHFQGSPGDRFKVSVPDTVARIVEVVAGSDAEGRGLRRGDIILDIAGVAIDGPEAARQRVEAVGRLGQREVVLSILSGSVYRQIIMPLGKDSK